MTSIPEPALALFYWYGQDQQKSWIYGTSLLLPKQAVILQL